MTIIETKKLSPFGTGGSILEKKPAFSEIIESPDYRRLVAPWKDDITLMDTINKLFETLVNNRDGNLPDNELDEYIDAILDGPYGQLLSQDGRFEGNAIHAVRTIVDGKVLQSRVAPGRNVGDKSGLKG